MITQIFRFLPFFFIKLGWQKDVIVKSTLVFTVCQTMFVLFWEGYNSITYH